MNPSTDLEALKKASNDEEKTTLLEQMATNLIIGGPHYINSFPVGAAVPELKPILERYAEEGEVTLENIHILVARTFGLMAKQVPRALLYISQITNTILKGLNKVQENIEKLKRDAMNQNEGTRVLQTHRDMEEDLMTTLEMVALQETKIITNNAEAMQMINTMIKEGKGIKLAANIVRKIESMTPLGDMLKEFINQLEHIEEDRVKMKMIIEECIGTMITRFPKEACQRLAELDIVKTLIQLFPRVRKDMQLDILTLLYLIAKEEKEIAKQILTKENIIGKMLIPQYLEPLQTAMKGLWPMNMMLEDFIGSGEAEEQMKLCMRLMTLLLPKIQSTMLMQSELIPTYSWYWEDDYHNFYPFQENESKALEEALQAGKKEILLMSGRYRVNVNTFKQYNVSTKVMRNVKRSNFPTGFERRPKVYQDGMFQSFEPKDQIAGVDSRTDYPLQMPKEIVKRQCNEQVLPIFLNLWDQFEHNPNVQEDIAQCITRMLELTIESDKSSLQDHYSSKTFLKLINKLIHHDNTIIVSHGLYILNEICQENKKRVLLFFIHENMAVQLETLAQKHTSTIVKMAAQHLQSLYFNEDMENYQGLTLEEEALHQCVDHLKKKQFSMDELDGVNDAHISVYQFIQSQFVPTFLKFLKSQPAQLKELASMFVKNTDLFTSFINLTNECIDQLENFQRVDDRSNPLDSNVRSKQNIVQMRDSLTVVFQPMTKEDMQMIDISALRQRQEKDFQVKMKTYEQQVAAEEKKEENKRLVITKPQRVTTINYLVEPLVSIGSLMNYLMDQFQVDKKEYQIELFNRGLPLAENETVCQSLMANKPLGDLHTIWNSQPVFTFRVIPKSTYCQMVARRLYKDFRRSYTLSSNPDYFLTVPSYTTTSFTKTPIEPYLIFMRLLYYLNKEYDQLTVSCVNTNETLVPQHSFENEQLTSKLAYQLRSYSGVLGVLTNTLPSWTDELCSQYGFMFSFSTRRNYFHYRSFGILRFVYNFLNKGNTNHLGIGIEIVKRYMLHRDAIYEDALPIFDAESVSHARLDFEYEGESGIGIGPTLEAYTLLSKEVLKQSRCLFRHAGNEKDEFVYAPKGVFPKAYKPAEKADWATQQFDFIFLGKLIGKALEDGCLLDIPFSPALIDLFLGNKLNLRTLSLVEDDSVVSSLRDIARLNEAYQQLLRGVSSPKKKHHKSIVHKRLQTSLQIDAAFKVNYDKLAKEIEDFCLSYEFGNVELVPNGADREVTIHNIEHFVRALLKYVLNDSVRMPVSSILYGMSTVFPVNHLRFFNGEELFQVLSGSKSYWSDAASIFPHLSFSKGFSVECDTIQWLVKFMCTLDEADQANFIEFCTGCRQLPIGGLEALSPPLTIVCASDKDNVFPTCNTCFHYLKLPRYSSEAILCKQLGMAIACGRGRFDLS